MSSDSISYNKVEKSIIETATIIGAKKALLFDSFSKKKYTEDSEINVVFIQDTYLRFLDRPDIPLNLLYKRIICRNISVFVYTPLEFATMKNNGNTFIQHTLQYGKVIYEL